jgi:nucleoid-associated protein YgaU
MGIFNFLKDVGQKLFDHDKPQAAHNDNQQLAQKLEQQLKQLNLGIEDVRVHIEGDKAVLEGKAASHEALEKAILAVGNTAGIAQVDSRITVPKQAQAQQVQSQFYTVKKGDTLSKIAKEMYGDANKYNEIFEANRPLLKDPDEIYPGQQLRIPQKTTQAA